MPLLTKMNDKESENAHSDPCDKNVVVSALKQKRQVDRCVCVVFVVGALSAC